MKNAVLVALAFLICGWASAAPMPMDSPWTPWSSAVTVNLAAQLVRVDKSAIAGQRVSIGKMTFLQSQLRVEFPGQKTTPMVVGGVRLLHSAFGNGWVMPEHPVNVTFPTPITVPAGMKFVCVYSMPITSAGTLNCFPHP